MSGDYRIERDSLGEIRVPSNVLYGAQTQRAVENFPISGQRFSRRFIQALGLVKEAAALTNGALGVLEPEMAEAIAAMASEVARGEWDGQFVLDVYQTGSGTSTNMNANEVIAHGATQRLEGKGTVVHPNDHVNMSQSSNDVIPTTIHVSAAITCHQQLIPAINHLISYLLNIK